MMKQPFLERFNTPLYSMLIVACLYLVFVLLSLEDQHWNPSRFVHAGDRWVDAKVAPENLYVFDHSDGYDGQFYYRIALNPFSNKQTDYGIRIDGVIYRKQRILYPFLAWLLSFGCPTLVPIVMILINYLALCWMGFIGGVYAKDVNRHALWGIVFPLYAGFVLTLSRDLTEILELSLLLSAFVSMGKGRGLLTAILLTLAVLTRESALLVVIAVYLYFIICFIQNRKTELYWYVFSMPVLAYLTWRGVLFYTQQQRFEIISNLGNTVGLPFSGFIRFFINTIPFYKPGNITWFIELYLIIVFTLAVSISFRSSTARNYEKYSWILYFVLTFMLTNNIWIEDWGFLRVISEYFLTGSIILLHSKQRLANYILSGSIASWFLLGVNVLHR